jgi:hypothetical protein
MWVINVIIAVSLLCLGVGLTMGAVIAEGSGREDDPSRYPVGYVCLAGGIFFVSGICDLGFAFF